MLNGLLFITNAYSSHTSISLFFTYSYTCIMKGFDKIKLGVVHILYNAKIGNF